MDLKALVFPFFTSVLFCTTPMTGGGLFTFFALLLSFCQSKFNVLEYSFTQIKINVDLGGLCHQYIYFSALERGAS